MRTLLPVTVLTLVAIADDSSGLTRMRSSVPDVAVTIRTFQFAPDTVRAKAGTRVVWSNADDIAHTITTGTPENPDGRLRGVVDRRGATYSATLERAGTYSYFCDRHRFMTGTVIVTR